MTVGELIEYLEGYGNHLPVKLDISADAENPIYKEVGTQDWQPTIDGDLTVVLVPE